MGEKFEQSNMGNFLEREEVILFIQERGIRPDHLQVIQQFAYFPKDLIISELHNFFNLGKERSGKDLERLIGTTSDEKKKELYTVALELFTAYGWTACYHLVRLVEKV